MFKEFETIEDCKEWLKNNDVNKLDEYNQNILFIQKDLQIIKYLIENTNININQLNYINKNILFYQDDFEIIKYLIENTNININELNCIDQNILFIQKDLQIIKYLIENTNIDIKYYLNNNASIDDDHYNYIKSFYEAREFEKELNKITSIKKDVKKLNKI